LKNKKRRPPSTKSKDLLQLERNLHAQGIIHVAGVDESGRGCLAGPVFAAAVILPAEIQIPGIDDSKKLSSKKRDELFPKITKHAVAWGVAQVDADEIDKINIHRASLRAMEKAVASLKTSPHYILVDGRHLLRSRVPQKPIIRGDGKSRAIAAASILAKVSRDRWMVKMAKEYPKFGFQIHKGYGTREHMKAIETHGLTPLHRRTFTMPISIPLSSS
jgi:ribonuclease HII